MHHGPRGVRGARGVLVTPARKERVRGRVDDADERDPVERNRAGAGAKDVSR